MTWGLVCAIAGRCSPPSASGQLAVVLGVRWPCIIAGGSRLPAEGIEYGRLPGQAVYEIATYQEARILCRCSWDYLGCHGLLRHVPWAPRDRWSAFRTGDLLARWQQTLWHSHHATWTCKYGNVSIISICFSATNHFVICLRRLNPLGAGRYRQRLGAGSP